MAAVPKKRMADSKPICKYGAKCYRKNHQHLQNYRHHGRDDDTNDEAPTIKARKVENIEKKATITNYFKKDVKEHNVSDSDEETCGSKKNDDVSGTSKDYEDDSNEQLTDDDNVEDEKDDIASPESPTDVRENIKSKFLTEMPEDFYQFWEFCKSLKSSKPRDALKSTLNLSLAGPYDILCGRHKTVTKNKAGRRPNFLLHHRFFYDPPEFQTVIVSDDSSRFHLGYYRDDPKESAVFVASNSPGDQNSQEKIYKSGDNLFAAVHIYASKQVKSMSGDKKKQVQELIRSLEQKAIQHKLSLAAMTDGIKARQKKVVCPTFHGAGIVVPVDDNEVGYRPVPETPGDLRAIFKRIVNSKSESERDKHSEDLQELITLVQFANDECDYGEGLELGLDLFSFGAKLFHPQIANLLTLAYQLLNRNEFGQIVKAHLKRRSDTPDQLLV